MKIKLEVEVDTENQQDLNIIEEVLDQIQDLKELFEISQQNLNKQQNKTSNRRK